MLLSLLEETDTTNSRIICVSSGTFYKTAVATLTVPRTGFNTKPFRACDIILLEIQTRHANLVTPQPLPHRYILVKILTTAKQFFFDAFPKPWWMQAGKAGA